LENKSLRKLGKFQELKELITINHHQSSPKTTLKILRPLQMSEIRKHYFLPKSCIIAEERVKRPSDFKKPAKEPEKTGVSSCVFCGGSEEKTPLATAVYKNGEVFSDMPEKRVHNWDFRCFPNLYPALTPASIPPALPATGLQLGPGYGFHEVIVEAPLHGRKIENFSDTELAALMNVYKDRTCFYAAQEKIRYVSLFKNSGEAAGASLDHSHSQLLALPFCPPILKEEIKAIRRKEICPYCEIFKKEELSQRLIFQSNGCIAFAPYYSICPFEVWILPEQHLSSLKTCEEKLLFALGTALRDVLKAYQKLFGNIPFNYMFYQLFETPEYHLNLRILPRISVFAGFELNTGVYINTVSPEKAASFLREAVKTGIRRGR
jgi:UDPglucose--hexose-1-phosphate uridylyltransferase